MKRFRFVTGGVNSGKSAYLKRLAEKGGYKGYLTLSPDPSKEKLFLLDLSKGNETPLMERDESGAYVRNEETFRKANEYLCSLQSGKVILDECGRMELSRTGFYDSLIHFMKTPALYVTIAVRDTNLERMISLLSLKEGEYEVIRV